MATCTYDAPSPFNIFVGVFLMLGISTSYIAQIVSIIKGRSSKGLSYQTIALAYLSSLLTLLNVIILNWEEKVACCGTFNFGQCLGQNLSIIQIANGSIGLTALCAVFLQFFTVTQDDGKEGKERGPAFMRASILYLSVVGVIFLLAILAVVYNGSGVSTSVIMLHAQVCGALASLIILMVWLPQIWVVFKTKTPGSLSLIMLVIQASGSVLAVYFQAVLNQEDVTTWGPYAVTAVEQAILIVLLLWIKLKDNGYLKRICANSCLLLPHH